MFLKQIFARHKYANINNMLDINPRQKHCCPYCSSLHFLPRACSKIISNYFQLFEMKVATTKGKI